MPPPFQPHLLAECLLQHVQPIGALAAARVEGLALARLIQHSR